MKKIMIWAMAVIMALGSVAIAEQPSPEKDQSEIIRKKLKEIKIPSLSFENASLEVIVKFISDKTKERDPSGEGIVFQLKMPANPPPPITIYLKNDVSVEEVLGHLAIFNFRYKIEKNKVVISP